MRGLACALVALALTPTDCTIATDNSQQDDKNMMPSPGAFGRPKTRTWALSGDLVTGQSGTPVTLQTSGDLQDTGYSVFSLKFGVNPPQNGKGFNALATILFTVNGNPLVRKVSIGQGVEIAGPADSIKVSMQDSTPAAYQNNGQKYQVTCQIAPGTRVSTVQPTLDDIAVGGSGIYVLPTTGATQTIQVPQGVGVVGAYLAALSNAVASVNPIVSGTWNSSGAVTNLYEFGLNTPVPQFVPIPPGAISLVAGNRDASNIAVLSVLWVIDG